MSKVFIRLIQLIVILPFVFLLLPKTTMADASTDCTIKGYGSSDLKTPPNQNMDTLTITLESSIIVSNKFWAVLIDPNGDLKKYNTIQFHDIEFTANTPKTIEFTKPPRGWLAGNYQILFVKGNNFYDYPPTCQATIPVAAVAKTSCSTDIENRPGVNNGVPVTLLVDNLNDGCYDIVIGGKIQPLAFCADGGKNKRQNLGSFDANKDYTVELKTQCLWFGDTFHQCTSQQVCTPTSFHVYPKGGIANPAEPERNCKISPDPAVTNRPISTLDYVTITAGNLTPQTTYNVWGRKQSDPNIQPLGNATSDAYGNFVFSLHNPTASKIPTVADTYEVRIYNKDDQDPPVCSKPYTIQDAKTIAPAPKATPCINSELCTSGGGQLIPGCGIPDVNKVPDPRGPGISTVIGCIHTSPAELVKDLMTFIVGISGGLAFLMMLLGAFQMLTSAGNPETLNAGKERLTSAVIGLLMVIFAVLLLQIIGVDILHLPGFVGKKI